VWSAPCSGNYAQKNSSWYPLNVRPDGPQRLFGCFGEKRNLFFSCWESFIIKHYMCRESAETWPIVYLTAISLCCCITFVFGAVMSQHSNIGWELLLSTSVIPLESQDMYVYHMERYYLLLKVGYCFRIIRKWLVFWGKYDFDIKPLYLWTYLKGQCSVETFH